MSESSYQGLAIVHEAGTRIVRTETGLSATVRYVSRVLAALLRSPREAVERIRERIGERRERRLGPFLYEAEPDWEVRLHALPGVD